MNYTMATMTNGDMSDPLVLSMDKCGNKYTVWLSDGGHDFTRRTFYRLDEAYAVFEKIASWMIYGLYTSAEKRRFLATGKLTEGGS